MKKSLAMMIAMADTLYTRGDYGMRSESNRETAHAKWLEEQKNHKADSKKKVKRKAVQKSRRKNRRK